MAEETHLHDTTSSRGAQWAGAGSLIAIAAQSLLNGGIGGILGGGNATAQAANAAVTLEMARKDAEIALLKSGQETDKKLVDVYTTLRTQDKAQDANIAALNEKIYALDKRIGETALIASNGITALNGSVAALQATVSSITKCVVTNSSVCPGWGNVTITPATAG